MYVQVYQGDREEWNMYVLYRFKNLGYTTFPNRVIPDLNPKYFNMTQNQRKLIHSLMQLWKIVYSHFSNIKFIFYVETCKKKILTIKNLVLYPKQYSALWKIGLTQTRFTRIKFQSERIRGQQGQNNYRANRVAALGQLGSY